MVTRKVLIHKGFKGTPRTVGEHIRSKRLADGLLQRDLAMRFGVSSYTLMSWESGYIKTIPAARMPAVISYLGFNPEPEPEGIGTKLRWKRRSLGWTTKEAAARYSVDPSTWESWEGQADWPAYPRHREFAREFLSLADSPVLGSSREVR